MKQKIEQINLKERELTVNTYIWIMHVCNILKKIAVVTAIKWIEFW
jgi:hypothetical protein